MQALDIAYEGRSELDDVEDAEVFNSDEMKRTNLSKRNRKPKQPL